MVQDENKTELKKQLPLELARRLEGNSAQFGKTAYMKLAYLLQELYQVPLGYRFSLYTYGPYYPEVLADLEYAKLRQEVNVEYLEDQLGFSITPGEKANNVAMQKGPISEYAEELDELVEHFGSFNARDLELRTTSIFLWKRIRPTNEQDVNRLTETVRHVKPHFDEKTIRLAVNGLLDQGVINKYPNE